eukprot:CAMPEP_0170592184 /NCGR_PEP_ID=MMETSP0224-20130122/12794_1 /TAXON_ID=285029 /ORGANISM="Togula jolla, Strain CCCM 725" /LENGTH=573 /DNA_ID=CAMNT_0010916083 /DNA_START=64 /DNA_END=1785 /DNA_ORIENTATION=+
MARFCLPTGPLACIVALLLPVQVLADLPVHCLRHQVVGEWRFFLGPLQPQRSSCGHARPDVEEKQPGRELVSQQGDVSQMTVTMENPHRAVTDSDTVGTWTMIYDEGFEVNIAGLNLFAFSNFTFQQNKSDPAQKYNVSHCGATMVGWYQNKDRTQFGCYYAYKVDQDGEQHQQQQEQPDAATHQAIPQIVVLARTGVKPEERPLDHAAQKKVVAKLNRRISALQLGWQARSMSKWNGRTMQEVNSYAGIRRSVKTRDLHRDMVRQHFATAEDPIASKPKSLLQRGRSAARITSEGLPKTFDWSDVNGVDYLEPVMDQQDCGSCYAASSMRMLTARHKIKQNNTELLPWSINFPLFCSEYNQGCKGGFGILLAKWSRDVGLLPATCMRYNTAGSCKLECDVKTLEGKRFRAGNHRYVGSFYGNSSVEAIQQELYENGPLVVGLEPTEDFMFYSEGIYKSPANATKESTALQSTELRASGAGKEWERVDHAVLLVGWGEEDGQEYWRVQNSWGPDWGEDGFFRIARGTNEASIESIPEAADVVEDEQAGAQVSAFFQAGSGSSMTQPVVQKHLF